MDRKGLSKHVPETAGDDSIDDAVRRQRRRSRWRGVAAAATAVTVLVTPAFASADVGAINQERAEAGLAPVTEDGGLTALARQQSVQMAAAGGLFHSSNLGGEVGSVLPSYTGAAENVGYGQSVASVTDSFMASSPHRAAILGNFNTAGVGVAVGGDGRLWVTQMFARTGGGGAAPVSASSPAPTGARAKAAVSGRRCKTRVARRVRRRGGRKITTFVRRTSCGKVRRAKTTKRTNRRRAVNRRRHRH
ncbi:MAG: CAP domain-containing protein [Actinomycetota bacterium]|nr:CAP domain-containing protein [Actinomycetota bacterium]